MLLKDNYIMADDWLAFDEAMTDQDIFAKHGKNIIPLRLAKKHFDQFMDKEHKAIVINPDDDATDLQPFIQSLDLILVHFPHFTDGRGYSHAHIIRNKLQWQGELRATGHILPDQYPHMLQCGFNSFCIDTARHDLAHYEQMKQGIALKYQLRSDDANNHYKTILTARR